MISPVLKDKLKKNDHLRKLVLTFYGVKNNLHSFFTDKEKLKDYRDQIEQIIKHKEIVLHLDHGGLGDNLVFTSLPRLLAEKYGVSFYLDQASEKIFRHPDIFKICFEMNPYFKGWKNASVSKTGIFHYQKFSSDRSWFNLLTDLSGTNITHNIEKQFQLEGSSLPEIYYKPEFLPDYNKTVLIDLNFISGHNFGWIYNQKKISTLTKIYLKKGFKLEAIDPIKQDIFRYADMIFSAGRFITALSGGAALAVALKIEADVALPKNARGESVYAFVFKNSKIKYW